MKIYIVHVTNHEFGTREREYRIEATSMATAVARGIRQALKEKIAGSHRIKNLNIKVSSI